MPCDANANARHLAQCARFFNGDAHPLTSKFANQLLRNVFRQCFQKLETAFRHPSAQVFLHLFAVESKALICFKPEIKNEWPRGHPFPIIYADYGLQC